MDAYPDPASRATAHRIAAVRAELHAERTSRAYNDLIDEFVTAAMQDADTPVRAPGNDDQPVTTAGLIVLDAIGAADIASWDMRRKLLEVLALACKSTDPTVRLPAQAFLARVGQEHANLHAAELAEQTA